MLFILIVLLIVENIILAYKFRNKLKQIITKFFKRHDVKNIQLKNETDAWYMTVPLLILHGGGEIKNIIIQKKVYQEESK